MKIARFVAIIATLLAITAVGAVAPARAQQPNTPTLSINQVDASAFPQVRIIVTALDDRGVPAAGLTAEQFQVLDGTDRLTVDGVQVAQDQGLRLATVITIDTSGSMQGEAFERARQAATDFVNSMGPNDEAALVAFNDRVTPVVALTGDRQKLVAGITGLRAAGGTALYEAVQTSAFIAGAAAAPRRAVILLSDGENDTGSSTATAEGSVAAARGSGVPIFTIGMGAKPDVAYLQSLSTGTQGLYRGATAGTLADVYAGMASLLRNQYVVTVRAAGAADGADADLQIIALVDGTPAGAVASFKRGSAPAQAQPPVDTPAAQVPKPESGGSSLPTIIFAAVIILLVLVVVGALILRWLARRRVHMAQLRVIEPNIKQAAAQPLDGPVRTPGVVSRVAAVVGTGVLREKNGTGQVYELGAGPAIIGTSAKVATIVFPASDQIAAEHARIWLRDGHYTLHHVGGMSRKTFVSGLEADWLVLESGDEVVVGSHNLIFEDPVSAKP